MTWARAALALGAVVAVALVLVSGGKDADPRTPAGLPGLPPPFLGTAVTGSGRLTAAVDAYGDIVDLRATPEGVALIDNPSARQAAGTVAADTGIVPRVSVDDGPEIALWRADSISQRYLPGTVVVRTVAGFGRVRVVVITAAAGRGLAMTVRASAPDGVRAVPSVGVNVVGGASCKQDAGGHSLALLCTGPISLPQARRFLQGGPPSPEDDAPKQPTTAAAAAARIVAAAMASDRAWLAAASPLGRGSPPWARRLYRRSLLTLRALTDRRTGAVAAGARDGWAYVWPRDAATAALALTAAGYRTEARRVADFLDGLDVSAAARFHGNGSPVGGRGPQGDAAGWARVAAAAFGLNPGIHRLDNGQAPDYQESAAGTFLGNAIASSAKTDRPKSQPGDDESSGRRAGRAIAAEFGTARGLVRRAGDPASGLDSAAAWAVRPFSIPQLYPEVRRTLLELTAAASRFGITPGEDWTGGVDPWTAPTAWTAWAFAALADAQRRDPPAARANRRQALRLLGDLRRAATTAGSLPERVDLRSGIPRSTTPLTWSHALTILALRQLWPTR